MGTLACPGKKVLFGSHHHQSVIISSCPLAPAALPLPLVPSWHQCLLGTGSLYTLGTL
jgi:hypothetical protein